MQSTILMLIVNNIITVLTANKTASSVQCTHLSPVLPQITRLEKAKTLTYFNKTSSLQAQQGI